MSIVRRESSSHSRDTLRKMSVLDVGTIWRICSAAQQLEIKNILSLWGRVRRVSWPETKALALESSFHFAGGN